MAAILHLIRLTRLAERAKMDRPRTRLRPIKFRLQQLQNLKQRHLVVQIQNLLPDAQVR